MKQRTRVRQKVLRTQQSKRTVMREWGLHWESLEKIPGLCTDPWVPGKQEMVPKIDP